MLGYPGLQSDPWRARSSRWGRSKDPIPLPSILNLLLQVEGARLPLPAPVLAIRGKPRLVSLPAKLIM